MIDCANCGQPVAVGATLCMYCGCDPTHKAHGERQATEPPTAAATATASVPIATPYRSAADGAMAVLTMNGNVLLRLRQDQRIVLGRKSEVPAIADPLNEFDDVSRTHVELTLRGDGSVEILDQSRFGTFVNGDQLSGDARRPFDLPVELRLAKRCLLRIEEAR